MPPSIKKQGDERPGSPEASHHVPPRPAPRWIPTTVLGLVASGVLGRFVPFQDPAVAQKELIPALASALFLGAAMVALRGVTGALRWMRQYALARKHPSEPWRWDHPWRREIVDEQGAALGNLLGGLIVIAPFLAGFNAMALLALINGAPLFAVFIAGAMALFVDVMLFQNVIRPRGAAVLSLWRYGRTRLRLPEIPLVPGTETPVELIVPRGLDHLRGMRAVVRQVREEEVRTGGDESVQTETVRRLAHVQPQRVEAQEGRQGNRVAFTLKLPPASPRDSTVLSSDPRCLWELHITAQVEGPDLDITFVLPVYVKTEGGPPAA
jgi:hypothetical protein